jgi:predicted alpha/beta-hydrolase family hydrolase
MMPEVTYKYYRKLGSDSVLILLHGAGPNGVESDFIKTLFNGLTDSGVSVYAFNFPYCERGDEQSSGPELKEETATLNEVVSHLKSEGYKKLVIIGKSLGGMTASYWLNDASSNRDGCELVILGYVIGEVKTQAIKDKLTLVIQGENDKYGNAQAVKDELAKSNAKAKVVEIAGADHSYRNENKEPAYMDEMIEELKSEVIKT